jgi:hypothetical protein
VGTGAIVLQHTRVYRGAMLAAGAVVAERGTVSPARARRRRPAREKTRLSASAERWTRTAAGDYSTETALRGSDAIGDDAGECVNLTRRHTPRAGLESSRTRGTLDHGNRGLAELS